MPDTIRETIRVTFQGQDIDLPAGEATTKWGIVPGIDLSKSGAWAWVTSTKDDPSPDVQELRQKLVQMAGPLHHLREA